MEENACFEDLTQVFKTSIFLHTSRSNDSWQNFDALKHW